MSRETFLSVRHYFWFWFSLVITVLSALVYAWDNPIGGRNGGTVVGYSLGVLSTLGILYLMWYGIRKRSYYARYTTLKAVLSSHVWIGVALVFIVPLHAGFSFGYNLHTATYLLMLLTVATGVWGVFLFRSYPERLASQRGGPSSSQLATALYGVNAEIKGIISNVPRSDSFLKMIQVLDCEVSSRSSFFGDSRVSDSRAANSSGPSLFQLLFSKLSEELSDGDSAKILEGLPRSEEQDALSSIQLLHKKRELYNSLIKEARAHAIIRGWLFLHVPLSVALCVLLALHIFSVFYYW